MAIRPMRMSGNVTAIVRRRVANEPFASS